MDKKTATMLYDGDCGFCSYWIRIWQKKTAGVVVYEPYRQALARFPGLREAQCRDAVQLILPDGTMISGAHAVLKAFDMAGRWKTLHWLYEHAPLFGRVSELIYQWIAHRRFLFSRMFFGSVKKCGV
jgi:predicted DCC family thiol-disulfide oxidoreductase YuxK